MTRLLRYGPWALVTGASDGIGRAMAHRIAAAGINVVLAARRAEELQALGSELAAAHGIQSVAIPGDLTSSAALDALVDGTRHLDIGLVVLAAGFGTTGTVLETSEKAELDLIAVNIAAVMRMSHVFAGRLAERGRGGLVLFGSIVGWQGVPGQANYAASKAYVQSLAEGLHAELRPSGVDVVAVAPGPVRSGFAAQAGLTMTSATPAEVVAKKALAGLGRRRTVVPGARSALLTAALWPLPRFLRSRILGRVIAGMRNR